MENLITFVNSTLAAAGEACTPCLISALGQRKSALFESIAQLEHANAMRGCWPESEENFTAALVAFMTLATETAAYTAVLMDRPGVRWIDESTEIALPVITIPN